MNIFRKKSPTHKDFFDHKNFVMPAYANPVYYGIGGSINDFKTGETIGWVRSYNQEVFTYQVNREGDIIYLTIYLKDCKLR